MVRNCDYCRKEYEADERNLKRGWGLCCSKPCAAHKREKLKPGYNQNRVERNNRRRTFWNISLAHPDTNYYGVYRGRSAEGYKTYEADNGEFTAIDEYDEPVYTSNEYEEDPGDSEYWDNKDFS